MIFKLLLALEFLFRHAGRSLYRIARFLYYFRVGKENKYPTCCVLHFALDGVFTNRYPAVRRGSIFDGTPYVYVPCGYHKGRHPEWAPWQDEPRRQINLFEK